MVRSWFDENGTYNYRLQRGKRTDPDGCAQSNKFDGSLVTVTEYINYYVYTKLFVINRVPNK